MAELDVPGPGRLLSSRKADFQTTSWSVIERAARGDRVNDDDLALLCSRYWHPVYAFLRRRGHCHEAAEDLTQSFFTRLIEKKYLQQADAARGRFRSFLLAAVTHFVANEADRQAARKRGGGSLHTADDEVLLDLTDDGLSPEQLFEKRWALSIIDTALAGLRDEMERCGRKADYDALAPFLTGDGSTTREVASHLGMSEGAIRVAVHRLRAQFRRHLRSIIGGTVADEREVEDEIRFLIEAVAR